MSRKQKLDVISYLSTEEYVTAERLARLTGVSSKTVRIRLKELSELLPGYGAAIESKPRHGYRLLVSDPGAYEEYLGTLGGQQDRFPETREERIRYLSIYLLSHEGYIRLDDICEFIYVSRATLSGCVKQVESYLSLFDLGLERRPNYGIRATGSEFNIRRALCDLFFNQINVAAASDGRRRQELKEVGELMWDGLYRCQIHLSEIAFDNFMKDVYIAVRRIRTGHNIALSEEMFSSLNLRENEWAFVNETARRLQEIYDITYTEDEKLYIALHLAGKKMVGVGEKSSENFIIHEDIDRLVLKMLNLIWQEYKLDFRSNLDLRMSMNQHMVPLDIRLRYGIALQNPQLEDIRRQYPMAHTLAELASTVLREWYGREIPEEEIGYLSLIFALALEQQNGPVEKADILIVCSSGKGSSSLLKHRYSQEFKEYLGQVYICDLYELYHFPFEKVDYIFTTVPIPVSVPKPILEIGLFLEQADIDNVRRFLKKGKQDYLRKYYREEDLITGLSPASREEAIRAVCDYAVKKDGLPGELYQSVMDRELLMATDYGNGVAIPHPAEAMTDETRVYVAVLDRPVYWSRQEVRVVILFVVGKGYDGDLQRFYQATTELISDEKAIAALIESPDYPTLMRLLCAR